MTAIPVTGSRDVGAHAEKDVQQVLSSMASFGRSSSFDVAYVTGDAQLPLRHAYAPPITVYLSFQRPHTGQIKTKFRFSPPTRKDFQASLLSVPRSDDISRHFSPASCSDRPNRLLWFRRELFDVF